MIILRTKKFLIILVIFQFFVVTGLLPTARAAFVSTQTLIGAEAEHTTRSAIQALLSREDVRAELIRLGVEPDMAQERIAALTPSELLYLQRHIDDLPTGAGVFALIGVVFVVLLILELVGVTNIFNKI